jgi:endoglucanase
MNEASKLHVVLVSWSWSTGMKQMISICKRFGMACALGAMLVGGGVGVAVAQGWWQMNTQTNSRPAPVQNRAYFPVTRCINIGGALEAPREGDWYNYKIRERDMRTISRAGFDTVRIPIKWSNYALPNPPYTISPAFFARIDEVMTWALQANLNVIINVHHYDELYADPDRHEPRLDAIWAQIAARYRTAPANVMFEIINEPRDNFSGERVNVAQARALSIIRQTNPTRTAILAGDNWGNIDGIDNLRLPNDPFVVGTVHYYSPFEFSHQGAEWMPNPPPTGRNWPRPGEQAQLQRDMERIAAFRNRIQAPVLMGEFGTVVTIPMAQRVAWTTDMRRAFDSINMPSCFFNYAAGFNVYDLQSEQWKAPLLGALGLTPRS